MMNYPKIFGLLLIAFALGSTACEDQIDDLLGRTITASSIQVVDDYPDPIEAFVAENYPNDPIDEVEEEIHDGSTIVYEVELESGLELIFDENGNLLYIDDDYDDNSDDDIDPSELPQSVIDHVSINYPGAVIVEAELDDDGFEVELSDGTELYFDLNGGYEGVEEYNDDEFDDDDEIDPATLPQSVLDYIVANYPGTTIDEAELDDEDGYEVELSDGTELYFDLQGNYISTDYDDVDDYYDQNEDNYIDPADLPQNVLDYIAANYPGLTIDEAEFDDEDGYEVELSDDTELYFDLSGNFIGTDDDDDSDDGNDNPFGLPQNIIDYIETNFPGLAIDEVDFDDDEGYEIELSDDTELYFDLNGNFIGADDLGNPYNLPQIILDFINENYPNAVIEEVDFDLEEGYEIDLTDGTELYFDADGNFIGIDD